jgi:hypothetical protein
MLNIQEPGKHKQIEPPKYISNFEPRLAPVEEKIGQ